MELMVTILHPYAEIVFLALLDSKIHFRVRSKHRHHRLHRHPLGRFWVTMVTEVTILRGSRKNSPFRVTMVTIEYRHHRHHSYDGLST